MQKGSIGLIVVLAAVAVILGGVGWYLYSTSALTVTAPAFVDTAMPVDEIKVPPVLDSDAAVDTEINSLINTDLNTFDPGMQEDFSDLSL